MKPWYLAVISRGFDKGNSVWAATICEKIKKNKRVKKIWPLAIALAEDGYGNRKSRFGKLFWLAGNSVFALDNESEMVVGILWRIYRDIGVDVFRRHNVSLPDFNGLLTDDELDAIDVLTFSGDTFQERLDGIKENALARVVYGNDCKTYVDEITVRSHDRVYRKHAVDTAFRKAATYKELGFGELAFPDDFLDRKALRHLLKKNKKAMEARKVEENANADISADAKKKGVNKNV